MRRIALATVVLAAAAGTGSALYPVQAKEYVGVAEQAARRGWEGVEANPVPVAVALGTFLLTAVWQGARGRPARPADTGQAPAENPVVARAKARAARTQLLADQVGLQNRIRKLPEAITAAEKDVCYAEQALADAERKLADREKAHQAAVAKLDALRNEQAAGQSELAEIEAELRKMAELV